MSVGWVKNPETAQCCGYLGQKYPYTEIGLSTPRAALSWQDQAWPQKVDGAETSVHSPLCNFPTAAEVLLAKKSFAFL